MDGDASDDVKQGAEPPSAESKGLLFPAIPEVTDAQPAPADNTQPPTDDKTEDQVAAQDEMADSQHEEAETAAERMDASEAIESAATAPNATTFDGLKAEAVPDSPSVSMAGQEPSTEAAAALLDAAEPPAPEQASPSVAQQDDANAEVDADQGMAEDGKTAAVEEAAVADAAQPMDLKAADAAASDKSQLDTEEQGQAVTAAANELVSADAAQPAAAAAATPVESVSLETIGADTAPAAAELSPTAPAGMEKPESEPAPAAEESGKSAPEHAKATDENDAQNSIPAGPVNGDAQKGNAASAPARGIKRPAPTVPAAKGAKLARTSQAAGMCSVAIVHKPSISPETSVRLVADILSDLHSFAGRLGMICAILDDT